MRGRPGDAPFYRDVMYVIYVALLKLIYILHTTHMARSASLCTNSDWKNCRENSYWSTSHVSERTYHSFTTFKHIISVRVWIFNKFAKSRHFSMTLYSNGNLYLVLRVWSLTKKTSLSIWTPFKNSILHGKMKLTIHIRQNSQFNKWTFLFCKLSMGTDVR